MSLSALIAEATALGGSEHPCVAWGHLWRVDGYRLCTVHGEGCSEPVYRCERCDGYDYEHRQCELGGEHDAG